MRSQNTSTASTRPSPASSGSHSRATTSMYSSARPWYSGGSVWAASSVVRTVTGNDRPSERATRSIFASSARVRP